MDEARLAVEGMEIDRINRELEAEGAGLRVLKSIEMDITPEGKEDMDLDALARLDLVLGAFHSKLRLKEDQTERYRRAIANPAFHILAHPKCRMFDRRIGLEADWPKVFEAAAEAGKAVEIDAHPNRQDLSVELLEVAREVPGLVFSMGTDAHSVAELAGLDFGLAAAARANIPRERILSFWSREDVLAWAASHPVQG
jgi:histidinol phosphatase-like PHP family hydrolase